LIDYMRAELLSYTYLSSSPLLDALRRSGGGVALEDKLVAPEMTSHLLPPVTTPVIVVTSCYSTNSERPHRSRHISNKV